MQTKNGPVHFNLVILLWQLGFCFLYHLVHSYFQNFSSLMKLASSISQSLKSPCRRAQGKTPHTTSLLLGSVWEAMFSLRDKAFQGTHVLRDTQMAPLKIWIRHSSQFHNAFLSEAAFPILQVIRMSNTFGPETPTQTLTQKEKHTQHSSLDQTHSKALFFFSWS